MTLFADISIYGIASRHQPCKACLVSPQIRLNYGEYCNKIIEFRRSEAGQRLRGCRVAVVNSNPVGMSCAFGALEGFVYLMAVLPADMGDERMSSCLEDLGVDALVSCDGTDLVVNDLRKSKERDSEPVSATRWILATSGTTATPKLVEHTTQSLGKSVKTFSDQFNDAKWALCYGLDRIAGIQVFLQSIGSGSCLIIPSNFAEPQSFMPFFASEGANCFSSSPTMWRRMLMTPDARLLSPRQITLGGEIADQKIIDSLRQMYPDCRVTHIYASTELGFGFSVSDGRSGFPASYLGKELNGITLKIAEDGELLVKAKSRGYYRKVEANHPLHDDDWFNTGDIVRLDGDRVYFLGRSNGTINVGGNKVHPEEIETLACSISGVEAARASGRINAITGSLVQLEIVVQSVAIGPEIKARVTEACQTNLLPYKVPAIIRIVDRIPTTKTGKVIREQAG